MSVPIDERRSRLMIFIVTASSVVRLHFTQRSDLQKIFGSHKYARATFQYTGLRQEPTTPSRVTIASYCKELEKIHLFGFGYVKLKKYRHGKIRISRGSKQVGQLVDTHRATASLAISDCIQKTLVTCCDTSFTMSIKPWLGHRQHLHTASSDSVAPMDSQRSVERQ
ncbi:unnamed protein product [Trichogramma brassicae]|uniref:Uncharacterized protein n=1 Tax=Trichogramma brassicae TaxID=86971 RepID=A0A6H5IW36_9HYME|nr:unnamed protein product [Trichogramma brassicae]